MKYEILFNLFVYLTNNLCLEKNYLFVIVNIINHKNTDYIIVFYLINFIYLILKK